MNAQKLSAAIKLSVEAALSSQETTVIEAVGILELHKSMLTRLAAPAQPTPVPITPAIHLPNGSHRG